MREIRTFIVGIALLIAGTISAQDTTESLGVFENYRDFGGEAPGQVTYDAEEGVYRITGSYTENKPGFFVYSKLTGRFTLTAEVELENIDSTIPFFQAGLMVMGEIELPSAVYSAAIEGADQHMSVLWKLDADDPGGWTVPLPAEEHSGRLMIVREEPDVMSAYYFDAQTGERILYNTQVLDLVDPIYVGIYAMSYDVGRYAKGTFRNVHLIADDSVCEEWFLHAGEGTGELRE